MKHIKNILLIFTVWIVSLIFLSFSFMVYSKGWNDIRDLLAGSVLLMIYCIIFSFPAFIFFFVVSFFTIRSDKLSPLQKRLVMLGANTFDIIVTFGALYMIVVADNLPKESSKNLLQLKNVFQFYPLWILFIVSSLLITTLPFQLKNNTNQR